MKYCLFIHIVCINACNTNWTHVYSVCDPRPDERLVVVAAGRVRPHRVVGRDVDDEAPGDGQARVQHRLVDLLAQLHHGHVPLPRAVLHPGVAPDVPVVEL